MKKQVMLLLLLFLGILLRSTIFQYLGFNISPDFALIMLVFFSFRYGSGFGQFSGFAAGLLEDFLSLSPLGFNALIKTIIGFVSGLFHDRFVMDPILFPFVTLVIVTFLKGILSFLIIDVFNISISGSSVFSRLFFLELIINALLAPILFQLLRILLDRLLPERKAL